MANFSNLERNGTTGTTITLNARASRISLPVVGGMRALEEAGALSDAASTHADAPVTGTVPATLSLTLGTPASFGAFTPGVAKDYTASTTANVISSAGDAALSVSDPGHLMNGAFALPEPLQRELLQVRVERAGVQRPGDDHVQPARERQRRAAHRRLLEDPHVHALDDLAMTS